jgi:hypothetical protein
MPVESADDRKILLADFGETVTYIPDNGPNVSVTGIFDNQYQAVDAGGSVDFAMVSPRLTFRTADLPNIEEGDAFSIRGNVYDVTIIMDDGTGITEIALEAE